MGVSKIGNPCTSKIGNIMALKVGNRKFAIGNFRTVFGLFYWSTIENRKDFWIQARVSVCVCVSVCHTRSQEPLDGSF